MKRKKKEALSISNIDKASFFFFFLLIKVGGQPYTLVQIENKKRAFHVPDSFLPMQEISKFY